MNSFDNVVFNHQKQWDELIRCLKTALSTQQQQAPGSLELTQTYTTWAVLLYSFEIHSLCHRVTSKHRYNNKHESQFSYNSEPITVAIVLPLLFGINVSAVYIILNDYEQK